MHGNHHARRVGHFTVARLLFVLFLLSALTMLCVSPAATRGSGSAPPDANSAPAKVFVVNSTGDDPDLTPGDDACDSRQDAGAQCTLRAAVEEADAHPGVACTILFDIPETDPGYDASKKTYAVTLNADAARGELRVSGDLRIDGPTSTRVVVAGHGSRVLHVASGGAASVHYLTLTDGYSGVSTAVADGKTTSTGNDGGAVYVEQNASLTLLGCVVGESRAGDGDPSADSSYGGSGGGIYNLGTLTLLDCTVRDNRAGSGRQGGSGGGIFDKGTLRVMSSTVSGNAAGESTDLSAAGGSGGGIAGDSVSVLMSTVSGNVAGRGRGDNRGGNGGGIYAGCCPGIEYSTIADNLGGADPAGRLSPGGGVYVATGNNYTAYTQSSIIARNNGGATDGCPDLCGTVSSRGNNLIGRLGGSTFTPVASDVTGVDPKLGPLADNGGPTLTRALLAGSPAIEAGSDDAVNPFLIFNFYNLATDQRGAARKTGAHVDIGAYEYGSAVPAPDPANHAPVAADDAYEASYALVPLWVSAPGVLSNDTDADGDTLKVQMVGWPRHGTATLRPDGGFDYGWHHGFVGTDSFTYRVGDGKTTSNVATVYIKVLPNQPPVALDDFYTAYPGQELRANVLLNDRDPDGDRLTAGLVSLPQHGSLEFHPTGIIAYTPKADFTGTDTFTYAANDGSMMSSPATVTVTVVPVPPPDVQFDEASYVVEEGCVSKRLGVTLKRLPFGASETVTVDYSVTGGTAKGGADYTTTAGRLVFPPYNTWQPIDVLVSDDGYDEGTESVQLTLSNPAGAALGSPASTTLYIYEVGEADPARNPIDDSRDFVCQNYHDFLGRQPDVAGWQFWTDNIERCGADAGCRQVMRVNTATAFFLSIEYQQTGYFVDRLYEACLGRRPHYEELMNDTRAVGLGVAVGSGDWQQRLAENKRAYTEAFVRRAEFLVKYPEGMAADEFVDEMYEYAGVEPTATERQATVAAFGAGDTQGRAAAMRAVTESASVFRRYYNRAFVLSEYFGYLRRDPNSAPDSDWSGYDFWLGKMDAFSLPGEDVVREQDAFARVRRAEMVRAFIESSEYRQRFGK